jgi:ATP-dependent Lon protease
VHVPSGAIPKDGPSAGVAMATALSSLISQRPARNDTAMTGELTLIGQVLPIGGLKEKALAAQAAGIKRVIAPKLNQQDIDDIPAHLRKDLDFIFVDRIEQVLREALVPEAGQNGAGPRDGVRAAARGSRVRSSRDGAGTTRKPARARAKPR